MNGEFVVYRHIFPNGKIYIGITSKAPALRWKKDGVGYKGQTHLYNAIKKYGWNNIKHEILFKNLTQEEAEQKEIELIQKCKSDQKEYGYNHAKGGMINRGYTFKHSEEVKKKLSKMMIGNNHTGR